MLKPFCISVLLAIAGSWAVLHSHGGQDRTAAWVAVLNGISTAAACIAAGIAGIAENGAVR